VEVFLQGNSQEPLPTATALRTVRETRNWWPDEANEDAVVAEPGNSSQGYDIPLYYLSSTKVGERLAKPAR
jgi:hypothetical protein